MDPKQAELLKKLFNHLEEVIKVYRHLLKVIRHEREILISADLDELSENNRSKEALLVKIRGLEQTRLRYTAELANLEGLGEPQPRLLDLATYYGGSVGDRMRNLHSVLDLLLKRVQENNKQNEHLVQTGLENITGAMEALRDTLEEKPVYERKGEMSGSGTQSGQLVSKEV